MRAVHCVGWYAPDSVGGSERYVEDLVGALRPLGIEGVVLAPRDGDAVDRYEHAGTPVWRYPIPPERDRAQHEGARPHAAFEVFRALLREANADIFHLHSMTYGANLHHLDAARSLGMATLSTAHVAGVLCERGTLMRFGREACDGRIDARSCVPCWYESRHVPAPLAGLLGAAARRAPAGLAERTGGRLRTLLRTPARIARRAADLRRLDDLCNRIVAPCAWLEAALLRNGVAREKLVLCRQGVAPVDVERRGALPNLLEGAPLRVGFFGRADPIKGIDVLIDAVRRVPPTLGIRLSVHALADHAESRAHLTSLEQRRGSDTRIQFLAPVAPDRLRDAMRACDVIAVPSRTLETGPLVAMEALAAGIPVLGSNLGGLCELVAPGLHGWLLPPDDVSAWQSALERLCRERPSLAWTPAQTPVLTHAEVARRHAELYRDVRP